MEKCIPILLESINAEEIDCIPPFIAVISNPKGEIEVPDEIGRGLSFELVCHRGLSAIQVERNESLLSSHQVISISCNSGLHHICFSDDFQGHLMILSKKFCNSIVEMDKYAVNNYYRDTVTLNLTEGQNKQYFFFYEWLKFVLRRNPQDGENRIRQLLRAAFYIFSDYNADKLEGRFSHRNDQIANQFLKILEEDGAIRSEDDYCEEMKVSKRTLSRAVKSVTGKCLSEHITEHKVARAKEMISAMSINTPMVIVSERLGFSTLPSFSRFFKINTGMTPREFKNSLM